MSPRTAGGSNRPAFKGHWPGRQMLSVKRGPYWVADCRSNEEVAMHVDLATLIPEQRT